MTLKELQVVLKELETIADGDTEVYVDVRPRSFQVAKLRRGRGFTFLSANRDRIATDKEYDDGDVRSAIVFEVI